MTQENMAALMRHGILKGGHGLKTLPNISVTIVRHKGFPHINKQDKQIEGKTVIPPINTKLNRDYLRPLKPYHPPDNVGAEITDLCRSILGKSFNPKEALSNESKYKLLNACFCHFKHSVPNGILHTIRTPGDVFKFYKTRVDVRVPFDKFKQQELPPNLHILYDYHRFHPDTDTKFGGVSAFPESSTIVTGLKYRKKYKGYIAKRSNEY